MQPKKKKRGIAALCLAVLFVGGGVWYLAGHWEGTSEQSAPGQVVRTEEALPEPGEGAAREDADTASFAEPSYLYVFLCGCVAEPGVYGLPEGSRLYEALALAGGYTEEAAEEYHNLARLLVDGERIYVPSRQEEQELSLSERAAGDAVKGVTKTGKININAATVEELMTLSGIGQTRAERIVEYRTKVGPFASTEELMNVSGIGAAMYEAIRDDITVE